MLNTDAIVMESDFSFESGYNEIMEIKTKLENDLKDAMRSGDDLKKNLTHGAFRHQTI